MDIQRLKTFLMWCTIINGALLLLSAVIGMAAPDFVYVTHSELFSISREAVGAAFYTLMGLFEIFWLVFNLAPYLALTIVSRR